MKRHISILIGLFLSTGCIYAQAQRFIDALAENPDVAACNYRSYEYVETELTPAPKGYKPFYISHYSRHGSRYHTSESYFRMCMPLMARCDSLGLLSDDGREWYEDARTVLEEHKGMFGMLTTLGCQEQYAIGKRIHERFPEVFTGRSGRTLVRNRSTRVQRSIMSMTSFNTAIAKKSPALDFSYAAGDKFRAYLNADPSDYHKLESFSIQVEDLLRNLIDTDRVLKVLFKDSEAAAGIIAEPYDFVQGIFLVSAISPNTDAHPDMLKYFHQDDILAHWIINSNCFYAGYGNSAEMASETATIARPLIRDIIEKADEALSTDSNLAADFRFGHDSGLLPLVATIAIEGMHEKWSAFHAHEHWSASEFSPMASNLQIVFFRNRKGDVLVKMLYNEKETGIPAIEAECGPYYSWPVLREYLMSLL